MITPQQHALISQQLLVQQQQIEQLKKANAELMMKQALMAQNANAAQVKPLIGGRKRPVSTNKKGRFS